jgi:hypothetical protein
MEPPPASPPFVLPLAPPPVPAAPGLDVRQKKSGRPNERERIQRRVEGFNWKKSTAWLQLSSMYGPKLNQDELISIAELCAHNLQIKLDRDARRRKIVIIKWFTDHWRKIHPLLHLIVLAD